MSTFTATPKPLATPPYVELTYDSGVTATQAVAGTITRNGQAVRIPSAVPVPAQVTTWKDYDAPFDVQLTYVFSLSTRQAPTGGTSENWQGTLSSKGWTSVTLTQSTNVTMRQNVIPTPSFESGIGVWTAYDAQTSIAQSSTQAKFGSNSLKITPVATTVTNLVLDPTFSAGITGWLAASGMNSVSPTSGTLRGDGSSGSAGNSYIQSPEWAVTANKAYYFSMKLTPFVGTSAGDWSSTNVGFLIRYYNSSHVQVGSDVNVSGSVASGSTVTRTGAVTSPAGAAFVRVFPFMSRAYNTPFATYFADLTVDNVMVADASVPFFYGGAVDTTTYQYDWTGTPNASTSTRRTIVKNAGAKVSITGLTPSGQYTFSGYYYGVSGGGAKAKMAYLFSDVAHTTGSSSPTVTETNAWQRHSITFTVPSGETSVELDVLFDNMGVTGDRFIDALLLEEGSIPGGGEYFDGTTSNITATSLGTWSVAWSGTTGASVSNARFSTVVNSGSASRNFNMASSGVTYLGFRVNDRANTIVQTFNFANGAVLTYTMYQSHASIAHELAIGSSTATMLTSGFFTGPMSLSFVNNGVFLTHVATGATINVPMTNSTLGVVTVAVGSNNYMMPFTILPGVILGSDSGTATAILSPAGAWLYHPYTPSLSLEIDAGQGCEDIFATFDSAREMTRTTVTSLLAPIGSRRMIAVSLGDRKDPSWELELSTKTSESYDAIVALLQDGAPLRFDYPDELDVDGLCVTGMRIPKGWFSPGDVGESRDGANWASPLRRWGLPLNPVAVPSAYPVE